MKGRLTVVLDLDGTLINNLVCITTCVNCRLEP